MTLSAAAWIVFKALWWVPFVFLVPRAVVFYVRKWSNYRNMR